MSTAVTRVREHIRGALRVVGLVVANAIKEKDDDLDTAPTITSGTGAPDHSAPNGSLYLRRNGGAATTVYTMASGSWGALGDAVTLSVGDDEAFTIGADTDFTIEYDEDGTNDLRITNSASQSIVLDDDMLVYFGAGKDIGIEYDEDGTDDLRVTQGASTPDLVFPDSMLVIFGTDKDASIGNDGSTGLQVLIADNDADAFEIAQGANVYLTCNTADDAERVAVSKIFTMPSVTTVAMGDAAHALVLGAAGAGETKLVGNIVFADAESSATEDLTLPAEASSTGLVLFIFNTGGEGIVVKDDGGGTIITIDTAQSGIVACDGTTWLGFMGAIT